MNMFDNIFFIDHLNQLVKEAQSPNALNLVSNLRSELSSIKSNPNTKAPTGNDFYNIDNFAKFLFENKYTFNNTELVANKNDNSKTADNGYIVYKNYKINVEGINSYLAYMLNTARTQNNKDFAGLLNNLLSSIKSLKGSPKEQALIKMHVSTEPKKTSDDEELDDAYKNLNASVIIKNTDSLNFSEISNFIENVESSVEVILRAKQKRKESFDSGIVKSLCESIKTNINTYRQFVKGPVAEEIEVNKSTPFEALKNDLIAGNKDFTTQDLYKAAGLISNIGIALAKLLDKLNYKEQAREMYNNFNVFSRFSV